MDLQTGLEYLKMCILYIEAYIGLIIYLKKEKINKLLQATSLNTVPHKKNLEILIIS